MFTITAYTTGQQYYVRMQQTYVYSDDGLEIGDGIDLHFADWEKLYSFWPQILFCFRFNCARKFVIENDWKTLLLCEVKKREPGSESSFLHVWHKNRDRKCKFQISTLILPHPIVFECTEAFKHIARAFKLYEEGFSKAFALKNNIVTVQSRVALEKAQPE